LTGPAEPTCRPILITLLNSGDTSIDNPLWHGEPQITIVAEEKYIKPHVTMKFNSLLEEATKFYKLFAKTKF
jgi:hypothetical protein